MDKSPIQTALESIAELKPRDRGQQVALGAVEAMLMETAYDASDKTLLEQDQILMDIAYGVKNLLMFCEKDGTVIEGFRTKEIITRLIMLTNKI